MSLHMASNPARTPSDSKDASELTWRPETMSDEQLLELHRRLERLHAMGDAFAGTQFSPWAMDRLGRLSSRTEPGPART